MKKADRIQKKYNQAARREIRKLVGQQQKVWEKAMKPKPKYLPKFIWNKLQNLVINKGFFEHYEIGGE